MKKLISISILLILFQYSFGQACGFYGLRYIGVVDSSSIEIQGIKLPSIDYLHGSKKGNEFIEIDMKNNRIEVVLTSKLTSHMYQDAMSYRELYMRMNESFLVLISYIENGELKERIKEIDWKDIEINKLEDDQFIYGIQLNLNIIKL